MATLKTTQDYYAVLKDICSKIGVQGISAEVLSQLLAQSLYFSEIENVAYSQEASLERATQYNSKIQLSGDRMYSVYRGQCPRVLLHFKSQKYFSFTPYDKIISGNSFDIYYIGYVEKAETGGYNYIYSSTNISPTDDDQEYTIIGLLSPQLIDNLYVIPSTNSTYINLPEGNLSNDIKIFSEFEETKETTEYKITRLFSEHILNPEKIVFDLTLPDLGSRLFAPDIFKENSRVRVKAFKFCELENFSESELKRLSFSGAVFAPFEESFLTSPNMLNEEGEPYGSEFNYTETSPGVIFLDATPWDDSKTIHYKANKERFTSMVLRSNSDLGYLLKEIYPEKVREVTYKYTGISGKEVILTPSPLLYSGTPYRVPTNRPEITTIETIAESNTNNLPEVRIHQTIQVSSDGVYAISELEGKGDKPWGETTDLIPEPPEGTIRIKLPALGSILDSDKTNHPDSSVLKITHKGPIGVYEECEGDPTEFGGYIYTAPEITDDDTTPLVEDSSKKFPYPIFTTLKNGTNKINLSPGLDIHNRALCWCEYIPKKSGKVTLTLTYQNPLTYLGEGEASSRIVCYSNGDILIGPQGTSIDSWNCSLGSVVTTNWSKAFIVEKGVPFYFSGVSESAETELEASLKIDFIENSSAGGEITVTPEGNKMESKYSIKGTSGYVYIYGSETTISDISLQMMRYKREETDAGYDDNLTLYYIPKTSVLLSQSEINNFKDSNTAYYVTPHLEIFKGTHIKVISELKLEIYKEDSELDRKLREILEEYQYKFGVNLEKSKDEIISLISKISTIKQVLSIAFFYMDEYGNEIVWEDLQEKIDLKTTYFSINYIFNTVLC